MDQSAASAFCPAPSIVSITYQSQADLLKKLSPPGIIRGDNFICRCRESWNADGFSSFLLTACLSFAHSDNQKLIDQIHDMVGPRYIATTAATTTTTTTTICFNFPIKQARSVRFGLDYFSRPSVQFRGFR